MVCLASGPSLTSADVEAVRTLRTIAINDAVRLAPWADVLYSSDPRWWKRFYRSKQTFAGQRYAVATGGKKLRDDYPYPDLTVVRNTGIAGFESDPSGLKTYWNSGGSAINLAVHFGASRILLLGYDMAQGVNGRHHFHSDVSPGSPYNDFRKHIATMVEPLKVRGVEVINCSRHTKLLCFPRMPLEQALSAVAA